jgi:hypothetical protein
MKDLKRKNLIWRLRSLSGACWKSDIVDMSLILERRVVLARLAVIHKGEIVDIETRLLYEIGVQEADL